MACDREACDQAPLTAIIIHAPYILDSSAGPILEQLQHGGIATAVLLEAVDARSAIDLQSTMAVLGPPTDVLQAACQPGTVGIALRSLIKQLDRQAASICVLAADHQCERLASLAPGCSICSVGGSAASSSLAPCANMFKLTHMREVIRHIVCSHSQGGANFVVGYAMKQSRATSLTKRGFFPVAAVDGISFVPLDLTRSISEQGPFAAILHKVSDMLELSASGDIQISSQFRQVIEYQSRNRSVLLLDQLGSVQKVLDRIATLHILHELPSQQPPAPTLRAPKFAEVLSPKEWPDLVTKCKRNHVSLPWLVKPAAACGITASHQMTAVLKSEGWQTIDCMLPAVVQEFVDHGAVLFKVYVIASEVHVVRKESFPDLGQLSKDQLDTMPATVSFDSLASSLPDALRFDVQPPKHQLHRQVVESGAHWLRHKLQLRFFGFDVVVDQHTGDHVIIDVNYFPSFKEVPEAPAKLRMTILQAISEQAVPDNGN